MGDPFFVRFHIDGVISVEVQRLTGGIACLRAWESLASDHVRLFSDRRETDRALSQLLVKSLLGTHSSRC